MDQVDQRLLAFFGSNDHNLTDLKTFFTTDVIINKWSIFNSHFLRKSLEYVLQGEPDDKELLVKLFDEVAVSKNGFAAMDFGYAFDYLIWNVERLSHQYPSYSARVATLISNALRAEVVPARYLIDAEIFQASEEDNSMDEQESLLR